MFQGPWMCVPSRSIHNRARHSIWQHTYSSWLFSSIMMLKVRARARASVKVNVSRKECIWRCRSSEPIPETRNSYFEPDLQFTLKGMFHNMIFSCQFVNSTLAVVAYKSAVIPILTFCQLACWGSVLQGANAAVKKCLVSSVMIIVTWWRPWWSERKRW